MRALWCPNHNTNPNPNPNYNRVKKEYILGSTIESRLFLKSVSKRDSLPRSLPPPPHPAREAVAWRWLREVEYNGNASQRLLN